MSCQVNILCSSHWYQRNHAVTVKVRLNGGINVVIESSGGSCEIDVSYSVVLLYVVLVDIVSLGIGVVECCSDTRISKRKVTGLLADALHIANIGGKISSDSTLSLEHAFGWVS